ncbi:hypothetical protein [Pisciglobus halotolerans]|uniref:YceG-like family protein n=1 Tax=Pisciglobus halotolerans TaxID=745365 RepID=A0A1I3CEM0_9LACT|nr:hypothetical protein [Pisciglobus halotolerans]SFH72964.1 hypothetical protein SAMN04489868_11725 [Pisciglobus halotolerans]
MSKPALRYLSLGFLLSAVILLGFSFFNEPAADKGKTSGSQELSKDEQSYKSMYESLLAETEEEKLDKEKTDSAESKDAEQESTKEADKETSSEKEIIKGTVVINKGDPSSTAVKQLVELGIIEQPSDFNDFLEEKNYTSSIRPGSHPVDSKMSFEEIAQSLMKEE